MTCSMLILICMSTILALLLVSISCCFPIFCCCTLHFVIFCVNFNSSLIPISPYSVPHHIPVPFLPIGTASNIFSSCYYSMHLLPLFLWNLIHCPSPWCSLRCLFHRVPSYDLKWCQHFSFGFLVIHSTF